MEEFEQGYIKAISDCFKLLNTLNNLHEINISDDDMNVISEAFNFDNVYYNT